MVYWPLYFLYPPIFAERFELIAGRGNSSALEHNALFINNISPSKLWCSPCFVIKRDAYVAENPNTKLSIRC